MGFPGPVIGRYIRNRDSARTRLRLLGKPRIQVRSRSKIRPNWTRGIRLICLHQKEKLVVIRGPYRPRTTPQGSCRNRVQGRASLGRPIFLRARHHLVFCESYLLTSSSKRSISRLIIGTCFLVRYTRFCMASSRSPSALRYCLIRLRSKSVNTRVNISSKVEDNVISGFPTYNRWGCVMADFDLEEGRGLMRGRKPSSIDRHGVGSDFVDSKSEFGGSNPTSRSTATDARNAIEVPGFSRSPQRRRRPTARGLDSEMGDMNFQFAVESWPSDGVS